MAADGFNVIKPAQGHCRQVKISPLMFYVEMTTIKYASHRIGGNHKHSEQSMNADQKSLETVFSIAICCQSGDKQQSKTMFLTTFDLCLSIVLTFSIACYPVCLLIRKQSETRARGYLHFSCFC